MRMYIDHNCEKEKECELSMNKNVYAICMSYTHISQPNETLWFDVISPIKLGCEHRLVPN